MNQNFDVIVVGGSAAGLSAALLLGRARRRVLVVDDGEPRNRYAAHMHGVLGWEGEKPADLIARAHRDLSGYDVTVQSGRVNLANADDETVTIELTDGTSATGRALIVATGVTDEMPPIPGFAQRWGTTVLHCPYCHGWEVGDQRLGVLGMSPMSIHQAELIRQWSGDVTLFTGTTDGTITVDDALRTRLASRGVKVVDSPVVEILGEGEDTTGVRLDDGTIVGVDALFASPRPRPNDTFLAGMSLDRADHPAGSFLAVDNFGATSHPLIWAVGNVTNPVATVPISIGGAAMTGGMVNMALITREFDAAVDRG